MRVSSLSASFSLLSFSRVCIFPATDSDEVWIVDCRSRTNRIQKAMSRNKMNSKDLKEHFRFLDPNRDDRCLINIVWARWVYGEWHLLSAWKIVARSPTAMRAIGKGKKNDNEPSGETKTSGRCYQLQMVSCIVFLSRDRGYFHFLANSGILLWVVLPLRNGREKRVGFTPVCVHCFVHSNKQQRCVISMSNVPVQRTASNRFTMASQAASASGGTMSSIVGLVNSAWVKTWLNSCDRYGQ